MITPAIASGTGAWTPGPWEVERRTTVFTVGSRDASVANVQHRGRVGRRGEAEANARLIASAPEMHEALDRAGARFETVRARLCRMSCSDGSGKAELVDYVRQCEAEIDALLAKAEGRNP